MIGLQDLDWPTQHLATDFVRGHLGRFDLSGRQIAIDAGETGDDTDLQWRLCKCTARREQHGNRRAGDEFLQFFLPLRLCADTTIRRSRKECSPSAAGSVYCCPLSSIFVQRFCISAGLTISFGWASDQR